MKFDIDEIVIMHSATYFTQQNGALGVIVGELMERNSTNLNTGETIPMLCYEVRVLAEDGRKVNAYPSQLRKLPPHQENDSVETELPVQDLVDV